MDETKPWYLSKTVWATVITILLSVLMMLKVGHVGPVEAEAIEAEQGSIAELLLEIATVVASAVALWGRLVAKKRLAGSAATRAGDDGGL